MSMMRYQKGLAELCKTCLRMISGNVKIGEGELRIDEGRRNARKEKGGQMKVAATCQEAARLCACLMEPCAYLQQSALSSY